jgi:hypothetical protein
VSLWIIGFEPQGRAIAADALVDFVLAHQGCTQVVFGLGKIRVEAQSLLKTIDSFVQLSLLQEGVAQVVVGLREVRPKAKGLAAVGHGVVQLALLLEGVSQVIVCFRGIGLQPKCPLILGNRFLHFAQGLVDKAQVGVEHGDGGIQGNRAAKENDSLVVPAEAISKDTQEVKGIGVRRFSLEDLAAELLGLGPVARFMMPQRQSKHFGYSGHVVNCSAMC